LNHEYIGKLQRGCAFIPSYIKGTGKATKIYSMDGGFEYTGYSVSKVMNDYCALNMRSMQSIKRRCQAATGRKCITPLYIKEDNMFMPVKTLRPFTRGDKCLGYINVRLIENVDFEKNSIKLNSGDSIEYLDTMETIKKRMGDCVIISQAVADMD
jgi:hypothetical protein